MNASLRELGLNGTAVTPKRDLRTGDVLVCYGCGRLAWLIEKATRIGNWRAWFSGRRVPCHVAMIVDVSDSPFGLTTVVESTSLSKRAELVTGRRVSGIQAHLYGEWLSCGTDRVEVWRLRDRPVSVLQRSAMRWLAERFARRTGYDFAQAIGSALPTVNREDDGRLFCSELVARWLEQAGVIREVNASELTPLDITMLDCFEPNPEIVR